MVEETIKTIKETENEADEIMRSLKKLPERQKR